MHYYQHNIKDFNNSTRHLTRVERCLYRDAIELYYDTEEPLSGNLNQLQRKLLCTTDEEKTALSYILNEFFYLVDDVYCHTRCDFEINKFQSNSTAKSRAGKASADAKKKKREAKAKQKSTGVEQVLNSVEPVIEHNSTNQEPRTINHKPITNNKDIKSSGNDTVKKVIESYNSIIDNEKPNWQKCKAENSKRAALIKSALKLVEQRAKITNQSNEEYLVNLLEAMANDLAFFSGHPTQRNQQGFLCSFETNFTQTRISQAIDKFAGE